MRSFRHPYHNSERSESSHNHRSNMGKQNWDPYYDGVSPSTARYSTRNAEFANSQRRQQHHSNETTSSNHETQLHHHHHHHHPYEYGGTNYSNSSLQPLDPFPLPSSHYQGKIDNRRNAAGAAGMDEPPAQVEPPITVHHNDVLMGRGGRNNQHTGNEKLRQLARGECQQYRTSSKKGKSAISRSLVSQMRNLQPPARFLKRVEGGWEDVGDDIAREKASQVLRDACALLQEEEDELPSTAPSSVALEAGGEAREPGPAKATDHHRKSGSDSHYALLAASGPSEAPSVENAASFPPPVENSRKRHRSYYSNEEAQFLLQGDEPDFLGGSPTRRPRRSSDADRTTRFADSHARRHSNPHSNSSATMNPVAAASSHSGMASSTASSYGAHPQYSSIPQQAGFHRRAPSQDGRTPPPQLVRQSSYGQHWRARPNIAARQASAASCSSSLLGELSGHNDFDLFDGGLLEFAAEAGTQGNAQENDAKDSKLAPANASSSSAPAPPQGPSS